GRSCRTGPASCTSSLTPTYEEPRRSSEGTSPSRVSPSTATAACPASTPAELNGGGPESPSGSPGAGSARRKPLSPPERRLARYLRSGTSPTTVGPPTSSTWSAASSRPVWPVSQALPQATSTGQIGDSGRTDPR